MEVKEEGRGGDGCLITAIEGRKGRGRKGEKGMKARGSQSLGLYSHYSPGSCNDTVNPVTGDKSET